jgi:hypothetical protein
MAGVKITDLTTLGSAASDDLLYIVDVSDTTESPQGTSKQIEVANILALVPASTDVQSVTGDLVDNSDPLNPVVSRPYLTWVGKLTQTGTADPTAVVLENTLGETLTYDRGTTGRYVLISPTNLFDQATTLVLVTAGTSTYNDCFVVVSGMTATTITLDNYGNGGGLQDVFSNMNIEIRVY